MATMKSLLIVGLLLGSTVLGGYRVFAGSGSAVAASPATCTPQECEQQCGPCPLEACTPGACSAQAGSSACRAQVGTAAAPEAQACTAVASVASAAQACTPAACTNR